MPASRPRLRAVVIGAAAFTLVAIAAGGTLAARSTPTVYACYNANGQVVMASIPQCKLPGGGQLVQLNLQGIQGPMGATGATGGTGPTGDAGAAAPTTFYQIPQLNSADVASSSGIAIRVMCGIAGFGSGPTTTLSLENDSGDAIEAAGGPLGAAAAVSDGGAAIYPNWTGQATIQAVGANGELTATVTVWSDLGSCYAIATF